MNVIGKASKRTHLKLVVTGSSLFQSEDRLVGHSIWCVYDLLLGRVAENDVQAVYLSQTILEKLQTHDQYTRMRVAGIQPPSYHRDEHAWKDSFIGQLVEEAKAAHAAMVRREGRKPDEALILYDRVAHMWNAQLIRPRPEEWGPVGKAYWTRNGEPAVMPWGDDKQSTEPALI